MVIPAVPWAACCHGLTSLWKMDLLCPRALSCSTPSIPGILVWKPSSNGNFLPDIILFSGSLCSLWNSWPAVPLNLPLMQLKPLGPGLIYMDISNESFLSGKKMHMRMTGTSWSLRSFSTQTILSFSVFPLSCSSCLTPHTDVVSFKKTLLITLIHF